MQNMNFSFKELKKKNSGFTLAEVLITLAIIGVVAALTIPVIIQKYQKQVVVTRLKKAYSIISQALQMSEIDNGSIDTWNYGQNGHDFFFQYLKPYIKYTDEPELNKLPHRYFLNGNTYNGTTFNNSKTSAAFNLADGSQVTLNSNNINGGNGVFWVGIDVNGFQRPNKLGRDTFMFFISPKCGIVPFGLKGSPNFALIPENNKRNNILASDNEYACNTAKDGFWCSALIMLDGWQIKDDYPW